MGSPFRKLVALFILFNSRLANDRATADTTGTVEGKYPSKLWEHQLGGTGRLGLTMLRRGNGVVCTRDGSHVWITADDGSLRLLRDEGHSATLEFKFDPVPVEGTDTECRSSVSLYEFEGAVVHGVYAVIDVPSSSTGSVSSRLIAVNPSGEQRFSVEIEGVAVGTPLIGTNGDVYITHNGRSESDGSLIVGKLSAFSKDGVGGEVGLAGAGGFGFGDKEAPFGPLGIASPNGIDVLYWAEAWQNGHAQFGVVYKFDRGTSAVSAVSRTSWSVSAAPAVSTDGKSLWIGGRMSTVYGWTGGHAARLPSWKRMLDTSSRRESSPIPNSPAITSDGTLIYVSSASTSFYCLDAKTGSIAWVDRTGSRVYLSDAKLSPDDKFLYTISHDTGTVTQHEAQSGEFFWQFSCKNITNSPICQDSVEASFSLSADGGTLYYGDIFGRVVSLSVAEKRTIQPSKAPSPAPSAQASPGPTLSLTEIPTVTESPPPTLIPTRFPTVRPSETPSQDETTRPTSNPTTHLPTAKRSHPPTTESTAFPTHGATQAPTNVPAIDPTAFPTHGSTQAPSNLPTNLPTSVPENIPTQLLTAAATQIPSDAATNTPSYLPTYAPSTPPTRAQTKAPTHTPTHVPTQAPSTPPTRAQTKAPTHAPTHVPTQAPSPAPTRISTLATHDPTTGPSRAPMFPSSRAPRAPTFPPSRVPTFPPSRVPTFPPSHAPTRAQRAPSRAPTQVPTQAPTQTPTQAPPQAPTNSPTTDPTPVSTHALTDAPTQMSSSPPLVQPSISPSQVDGSFLIVDIDEILSKSPSSQRPKSEDPTDGKSSSSLDPVSLAAVIIVSLFLVILAIYVGAKAARNWSRGRYRVRNAEEDLHGDDTTHLMHLRRNPQGQTHERFPHGY